MKKILLTLLFLLTPSIAFAACNGVFQPATICGNLSKTAAPPQAWPTSGSTFGPASGSTSGDAVVWQGNSGQQLGDAGHPPILLSGIPSANFVPVFSGNTSVVTPTKVGGVGGLFDSICSSTIGQFWVRLSNGWGCTSLGYANPVWWGADPTGVGDSASAFNNAIAALGTNGGTISFPPGTFKLNSAISKTLGATVSSLVVQGAGQSATVLDWPNASGGLTVNYDGPMNSAHVRDLSIATGQAGGGTGLTLSQGGTCEGNFAQSSIERVTFRGSDNTGSGGSNYWTAAYAVNGVSGVNVDGINAFGPSSGASGNGGNYEGLNSGCYALVENIHASNFQALQNGVTLYTYVQGFTMSQSNIENGANGLILGSGGVGFAQVAVSDSQFNQTGGAQILIQAPLAALLISNNLIYVAANSAGIDDSSSLGDFMITGNDISGNSTTGTYGIALTGSTISASPGTITGNGFKTLAQAILFGSSVGNVNVQANSFQGNTATIANSGTANVIANNVGYNPVGVTPGNYPSLSTSTYTAGASPETHYLINGSVSAVKIPAGGTSVCTTTPCQTNLGPNETMSVTFSGVPSDTIVRH